MGCAKMDHPTRKCTADKVQYSYTLDFDAQDPDNHWKKSITCTDDPTNSKKPGKINQKFSCRRSMCECDKRLAEELRENFSVWNEGHSTLLSDFDTATCTPPTCDGGNCGGEGGELQCCGNMYGGGARFPYNDHNGARGCCGDKTYDTTMFECCADQTTVMGSC